MPSPLQWPRVRIIRQQDAIEDGAACLAMVAAYFGRPCTVAQCRAACVYGGNGLTAEDLVEAARTLGLPADDWIIQGADAFDDFLSLPAIVNWHDRHFVVVEHVTRRHVTLVDPAHGRRRIARELFDRFCSGVAVTFTTARNNSDASEVREVRWMAGVLIASTLALQICSLALPIGLLLIVDSLLPRGVVPSLWWVMTTVGLVVMGHMVLQFVRSEALVRLRMVRRLDGLPGYLMSQVIEAGLHVWFVIFSLLVIAWWSPLIAAVAGSFCFLRGCVAGWASRRLWVGSVVDCLVSGVALCALLGLLVLGAHQVLNGGLTIGGMVAVNVLAARAIHGVGGDGGWDREREGWR